ncbi:MAG: hypothetical protein LBH20_06615, partial [Treponema sp.]|nr:hypothetical protein [Treponema sp.]
MKSGKIFIGLAAIALVSCNNFFHELVPPDGNSIVSFEVPGQTGPAIIIGNTVEAAVEKGTDLRSLLPKIGVSPKASLFPLTLDYIRAAFPSADLLKEAIRLYTAADLPAYALGLIERNPDFKVPALDIPIDFSGPVDFFVVSGRGTVRQYTVYVKEDRDEPKLLGLRFAKYDNPELVFDAACVINEMGRTISAQAAYPAEMDGLSFALIPSFEIFGDGFEVDGRDIQSGVDSIQFDAYMGMQSKTLRVLRYGEYRDYELAISFSEDPDTVRSITDFRFNRAENPSIAATAVASIFNTDGTGTISVQAFYSGAEPPSLTPRFVSPGTVSVNGLAQTSGASPQDFSSPLEYRVVSRNGLYTRLYTVRVELVSLTSGAPRITSFRFSAALNPELSQDAVAEISDGLIMIDAKYSGASAPVSLVPEFSAEGLVKVLGSVQVSGMSGQDFGRQLSYKVTNPGNALLERDYRVQCRMTRDSSSDAAISAFGFYPGENPCL